MRRTGSMKRTGSRPLWLPPLAALCALAACGPGERIVFEDMDIYVDLAPCVSGAGRADDEPPARCAGRVRELVGDGAVNACLLVRHTAAGAVTQRLAYRWSVEGLRSFDATAAVDLDEGGEIEAKLFLLADAGADARRCDPLQFDAPCTPTAGCVLALVQARTTLVAGARLDFTRGGRCASDPGSHLNEVREACDGDDDDCDGIIDEDPRHAGQPCLVGEGACARAGLLVCQSDPPRIACSAEAGDPAADETCPASGGACCDGVDDDCDGSVDEGIGCGTCLEHSDCAGHPDGPFCVKSGGDEGACGPCDPRDHGGCGPDALCCARSEGGQVVVSCEPTNADRDGAGQCTACGVPCAGADTCSGRRCRCGFAEACSDPSRPICLDGVCVGCGAHADCAADELCCDAACRPTDFALACEGCDLPCPLGAANRCSGRTCLCGDGAACEQGVCSLPDGCLDDGRLGCEPERAACAQCARDVDCAGRPGIRACHEGACVGCRDDDDTFCREDPALAALGRVECFEQRCVRCDPRDHAGCAEDGPAPICALGDTACHPCREDAECILRPGDRDLCVDGRCRRCDPRNGRGCDDPDAPICAGDGVEDACRPCARDDECEAVDRAGFCQGGRCVVGCQPPGVGCDPEGARPVCTVGPDGAGVCRPCAAAAECAALDVGLAGCLDGRCTACDARTHAPCDETEICLDGACRGCAADAECALRGDDRVHCVAGACARCPAGGCVEDDFGEGCEVDGQCAGGICLDDDGVRYCSRPCADGGDCGPDGRCVDVDGQRLCVRMFLPCANDCDCPGGLSCAEAVNLPGVATACRPLRPGGLPTGAECDPNLDGQCATGLCFARIGRCVRLCCEQAGCEAGTRCVFMFNHDETALCVNACSNDTDCPDRAPDPPGGDLAQEVCRYRPDAIRSAAVGVCDRPYPGGGGLGSPCGDDNFRLCAHELCWDYELPPEDHYCTTGCEGVGDCPPGWQCRPGTLGELPVRFCLDPSI